MVGVGPKRGCRGSGIGFAPGGRKTGGGMGRAYLRMADQGRCPIVGRDLDLGGVGLLLEPLELLVGRNGERARPCQGESAKEGEESRPSVARARCEETPQSHARAVAHPEKSRAGSHRCRDPRDDIVVPISICCPVMRGGRECRALCEWGGAGDSTNSTGHGYHTLFRE